MIGLDRGLLTVDQLNWFLNSMPLELTYADSNNQFLYYNHNAEAEDMLAKRQPGQVGNPLANCHPPKAYKNVEWVIQQLRSGNQDRIRVHVPNHGPNQFVVHNYQAIHDEAGNYAGINEYILDLQPWIDWYLQQTGYQLLTAEGTPISNEQPATPVDGVSGASKKAPTTSAVTTDAVSGASEKPAKVAVAAGATTTAAPPKRALNSQTNQVPIPVRLAICICCLKSVFAFNREMTYK